MASDFIISCDTPINIYFDGSCGWRRRQIIETGRGRGSRLPQPTPPGSAVAELLAIDEGVRVREDRCDTQEAVRKPEGADGKGGATLALEEVGGGEEYSLDEGRGGTAEGGGADGVPPAVDGGTNDETAGESDDDKRGRPGNGGKGISPDGWNGDVEDDEEDTASSFSEYTDTSGDSDRSHNLSDEEDTESYDPLDAEDMPILKYACIIGNLPRSAATAPTPKPTSSLRESVKRRSKGASAAPGPDTGDGFDFPQAAGVNVLTHPVTSAAMGRATIGTVASGGAQDGANNTPWASVAAAAAPSPPGGPGGAASCRHYHVLALGLAGGLISLMDPRSLAPVVRRGALSTTPRPSPPPWPMESSASAATVTGTARGPEEAPP